MNLFSFVLLVSMGYCRALLPDLVPSDKAIPYAVPDFGISNELLVEDAKLNFTELAKKYGYPAEEHTVVTRDGYLLKIFRITGKEGTSTKRCPPVLMMHGLFDSADTWLMAGPGVGLGYGLADAGYDVWCASHRGSYYGRSHKTLDPDRDARFWNFAFDELGRELATVIDYVLECTECDDLFYVGHSQGTSDFFVMASSKQEYNKKVRLAVLLSPVAWLDHVKSEILKLLADESPVIQSVFNLTGTREVLGRKQLAHHVVEALCTLAPETLCTVPILAVAGDRPGAISRDTLQVVAGHYGSGSSVKNVVQFGQVVHNHRYAQYDYGREENKKIYGASQPPEYDLKKVSAPVVLVCGRSDRLSVIADVDRIYATLPNVIDYYVVPTRGLGHGGCVWGEVIPKYITPRIKAHFDKYARSDD